MKALVLIFSCLVLTTAVSAQLKATPLCPEMMFDVLDGSINKIYPKSTQGEITKTFPCASDVIPEDSAKCAGVFFSDRGVYFFTDRDYIEIRANYTGKTTIPLIGATRASLFNLFGKPSIKDITWDAYQTQYGVLVVYVDKDSKINKVQFSNKSAASLKLCD